MLSKNAAVDETGVVISSVACLLRSIKVLQKTEDAPVLYLQVFNHASPTVGTTAPVMVLQVPAGITGTLVPETTKISGTRGGKYLATALTIAVTTTHDGNTAPDAGDEPDVDVDYQTLA